MSLHRFIAITGLIVASSGPVMAQFPREGVPDIPNGTSGPFVGSWSTGYPEGFGMINVQGGAVCEEPVVISANGAAAITYVGPNGQNVAFELTEFSGRTTWFPDAGESIVAVWTGPDEFFTYSVELSTGSARWDSPIVYSRCP